MIRKNEFELLRKLCYKPPSDERFKDPPMEFHFDPKIFICAQIPGILPNETCFYDALEINPDATICLVEFIGYERRFLLDMMELKNTILPKLENTEYTMLYEVLSDPLERVIEAHSTFASGIREIVGNHNDQFFLKFIDKFTSCDEIFKAHQEYNCQTLRVETMIISFSAESSNFDDVTMSQLVHMTIDWQQFAMKTAISILRTLPTDFDEEIQMSLVRFVKSNENLTASVDSLPKLEQVKSQFLVEPFPIVTSGRRFIKQGHALKQCRKQWSERDIILFSDVFVYAQKKGGMLMVPACYALDHLRVELKRWSNENCLALYAPRKSFVLQFTSSEERDIWFDTLSEAIKNIKLTVGDLPKYREAPVWIPDNETNACMNCKQTHTFLVRRHHCRMCGKIYCADCISKRALVPNISSKKMVKVCDSCYQELEAEKYQQYLPGPTDVDYGQAESSNSDFLNQYETYNHDVSDSSDGF